MLVGSRSGALVLSGRLLGFVSDEGIIATQCGVRPSSRTGGEPTIDQGAGPCRSKAMARHRIHSLAFKKQVVQEYAAGATLNALAREHDLSRTLIRIWIAKCESGEFDPDVEAATCSATTRPRSRPSSGWSAGRRSRSSS